MTIRPQAWLRVARVPDADRSPAHDAGNADERAARRNATASEVGLMHIGDEHDFCRIRNISPTGLMAQVYRTIWAGDDLDIDLKCGLSLHGTVVWSADHVPPLASHEVRQIGVRFYQPIDIAPLLSSDVVTHTGTLQRWPRLIAGCPLRLILEGGRHLRGRLCDISQQGAKFLSSESIPEPSAVSLVLRGLPLLRGSVRWRQSPIAGVAFDKPIGLETLAHWIQQRRAEGLIETGSGGTAATGTAR